MKSMPPRAARVHWISLAAGLAFAGVVLLLCHWGASVFCPDSVSYVRFAQTGHLKDLPFHHGIGYPLVLRLLTWHGDWLSATRLCNAACGFFSGFLLTHWFLCWFGRKGLFGSLLVLANYAFLQVHATVMSEPLFLACLVLAFSALWRFSRNRRRLDFVTALLALAFACLVRYAALPFVAAAALLVALASRNHPRPVLKAALFLCASVAPLALVLAANRVVHGSATNRILAIHFPTMNQFGDLGSVFASWIMPDRIWLAFPSIARTAVPLAFLAIVCLACAAVRKKRFPEVALSALPLVAYLAFLVFSFAFFDANIPFDHRMLSPLTPFFSALFMLAWSLWEGRNVRRLFLAGALGILALDGIRDAPFVARHFREGAGYHAPGFRDSAFLSRVKALAAEKPLYASSTTPLEAHAIANVRGFPMESSSNSLLDNPNFDADYADMLREIRDCGARVVCFSIPPNSRLVPLEQVVAEAPLALLEQYPEGNIYGFSGTPLIPAASP